MFSRKNSQILGLANIKNSPPPHCPFEFAVSRGGYGLSEGGGNSEKGGKNNFLPPLNFKNNLPAAPFLGIFHDFSK